MLEIIFIIFLTKKLAAIAKGKNRSAGWAAFGPVLWILGEVTGAAVAALMGIDELALYGGALVGAVAGAGIAFAIVSSLSARDNAFAEQPFVGGHYDPTNPYNAPGTNPYQAAPPRNDGGTGPFNR